MTDTDTLPLPDMDLTVCRVCGKPMMCLAQRPTSPSGWRAYCAEHLWTEPEACRHGCAPHCRCAEVA